MLWHSLSLLEMGRREQVVHDALWGTGWAGASPSATTWPRCLGRSDLDAREGVLPAVGIISLL